MHMYSQVFDGVRFSLRVVRSQQLMVCGGARAARWLVKNNTKNAALWLGICKASKYKPQCSVRPTADQQVPDSSPDVPSSFGWCYMGGRRHKEGEGRPGKRREATRKRSEGGTIKRLNVIVFSAKEKKLTICNYQGVVSQYFNSRTQ